ncbi:MAG: SOS response-associated peptidase [Roseinatronobacter sp.]
MCGRFALTLPNDAMARLFAARPANDLPDTPRFNICPTQSVAVVIARAGARHLGPMRWGLIPTWYKHPGDGPLLFNARAETLAEKPAFAEAARQRRCLIPASAFYEWRKDGAARVPFAIAPEGSEVMAFAGVWQVWERDGARQASCAIVTCAANDQLRPLHDRMPVILPPADWALWLGEAGHGAARVMRALPVGALRVWPVGQAVNSNRAEGPDLLEPI